MALPCLLCGSNEKDELIFGELDLEGKYMVHRNCLVLCMGKFIQSKKPSFRQWNFLNKDFSAEKRRFKLVKCSYCPRLGANLSCCHAGCTRSFHTKCGVDNLALLQYGGKFDRFCAEHVPQPPNRPKPDEECVLCLAPLVPEGGTFSSALAFQAPCCQNGWFHRVCLQEHSNATTYPYNCPLCRDGRSFFGVYLLGVSVPKWRYCLPSLPPVVSSASGPVFEAVPEDWDWTRELSRGPRIIHTRPVPYRGRASRFPRRSIP